MKVSAAYASPLDLVALAHSLKALPSLRTTLEGTSPLLDHLAGEIGDLTECADKILGTLADEPPARLQDGGVIREGFHEELDELRTLQREGKSWVSNYQQQLRESLGIKTLKVAFNRMFGYYLEVSRGQASRMPDTFQRRQTLVNSERFISPELKEYEQKILSAEERISSFEQEIFIALRRSIAGYTKAILETAKAVAQVDCLLSFARIAQERGYCCPVVDESCVIKIEGGRHPVLEASQPFTANSTLLNSKEECLHLITGPNMGGKSTYIRQAALLTLMAQMGSYIPAESAQIGLVDRLFSRIGASDDLAAGQSTFMVEMTEAANICNNATGRSLVILDEIGRGTSTYDGISIAWAIAEHLLSCRTRTLFATHYFELTRLEQGQEGARNYHVSAQEVEGRVVFLHKVVSGPADRSYGIHVGQLAGLPSRVIQRAEKLLEQLEQQTSAKIVPKRRRRSVSTPQPTMQLSLFEPLIE
jgi:DNA mismatch repair protein MutS